MFMPKGRKLLGALVIFLTGLGAGAFLVLLPWAFLMLSATFGSVNPLFYFVILAVLLIKFAILIYFGLMILGDKNG